jgi:putative oxidoreductase
MKGMDVKGSRAAAVDAVPRTVLRGVLGVVMTAHGWQKLTAFADWHAQVVQLGIPVPDVTAWLAIAGELLGGLGLLFGLLTRIAGVGVLGVMVVAIATVHIGNGLFAQNGGFEFPLLIAATALYFVATGAGPVSLDALLRRHTRQKRAAPHEREHPRAPYVPPAPEQALYDRNGRRPERPEDRPGNRSERH